MRKRPTFRFCCLICWRGCCLTANCILLAILGLQGIIAILLLISPDLPIPNFLESRINKAFASQDINAQWENAYLDLRGRLTVDGLTLQHRFDQDQLLQVGTARIDINWLALRDRQKTLIEEVLARDIRLYGRNSRDPVLRLSNLEVDHGRTWYLQEAAGRWQGINFIVSGPIPQEIPRTEPPEEKTLAQRMREVALKVEETAAKLPQLDGAGVQINLLEATEGPPLWRAQAYLRSLHLPEPAVQLDYLLLDAEGPIDPQHPWHHIKAELAQASYQDIVARRLELQARPGGTRGLATGMLRVSRAAQQGVELQHTVMTWWAPHLLQGEHTWQFDAVTNAIGGLWLVNGHLDTETKAGSFDIFTEIDPDNILSLPRLKLEQAQEEVHFDGVSRVEAHLELQEGGELGPVDMQLRLDGLVVRSVPFNWGTAHGRIEDGWLHLDHIQAVTSGGQHAVGAFGQSLDSRDFYLRFEGNIYPQSLNPMFGSWYDGMWEGVEIPGPPPWASIQIRSQWGVKFAHRHLLAIELRDIIYRDQPLDVVDLRIRQNDDEIQLVHLDARTGHGQAITGQVSWQLDPSDPAYRIQRVNVRSTLPVPALETALKFKPGTFTSKVQSSVPPRVAFTGQIRSSRETKEKTPDIVFSFSSEHPFTALTLPVDSAVAEGSMLGQHLSFKRLHGTVFGGQADATAELQLRDQEDPLFDVALTLTDANYTRALHWVQNRNKALDDVEPLVETDAPPGILDLQGTLHGQGTDLATYSGQGQVKISEAELQRVRLLGGLSRLLEEVGITFTTSPLREVQSELKITSGTLTIPDMSISGPGLKIKVDGTVELPDQSLALNVKTSPGLLRGAILGNVVTGLLTPLGGVLEMRVTGNLADPQWGWKWNPFRGGGSSSPEDGGRTPAEMPQSPSLPRS